MEESPACSAVTKIPCALGSRLDFQPAITKRPTLILGRDLASSSFDSAGSKHKQPCRPGEIYCVRCRAPKFPAGDMAEYQPITEKLGNLTAICPDCGSIMNRRVSLAKLGQSSRENGHHVSASTATFK